MKRTCDLCGMESDQKREFCECGGVILPQVVTVKKVEEPWGYACLVCEDTGHVSIQVPEGVEVLHCPRGCAQKFVYVPREVLE